MIHYLNHNWNKHQLSHVFLNCAVRMISYELLSFQFLFYLFKQGL